MLFFFDIVVDLFLFSSMVLFFYFLWIATPVTISGCSVNTSHTSLKKAMTNSDHRTYKNTAYIRINMLYFYILYKRGHYFIIETLDSHFSWAMTAPGSCHIGFPRLSPAPVLLPYSQFLVPDTVCLRKYWTFCSNLIIW